MRAAASPPSVALTHMPNLTSCARSSHAYSPGRALFTPVRARSRARERCDERTSVRTCKRHKPSIMRRRDGLYAAPGGWTCRHPKKIPILQLNERCNLQAASCVAFHVANRTRAISQPPRSPEVAQSGAVAFGAMERTWTIHFSRLINFLAGSHAALWQGRET
jgi:hypothetical protein